MDVTTSKKSQLLSMLIEKLEADLIAMKTAALAAHDAATNEESKPENEYDTRGLEASYLAGAQAKRAAEIDKSLALLRQHQLRFYSFSDKISAGALVRLLQKQQDIFVFLLPAGGGEVLQYEGRRIQVLTVESELGEALMGQESGGSIELERDSQILEYAILGVE